MASIDWDKFCNEEGYQTHDMCLDAVKSAPQILSFVENPSFEIYEEAISYYPSAVKHIKKEDLNENLILDLLGSPKITNIAGFMFHLPESVKTYKVCYKAIAREGITYSLGDIPTVYLDDYDLQLLCLRTYPLELSTISAHTIEMALTALEASWSHIIFNTINQNIKDNEEFKREFKLMKLKNGPLKDF